MPPKLTSNTSARMPAARNAPAAICASTRLGMRMTRARPMGLASDLQQQALRVLDIFLDLDQEGHRALAVDHTVVVGKRKVHHRSDYHLAFDRHRPVLDLVH